MSTEIRAGDAVPGSIYRAGGRLVEAGEIVTEHGRNMRQVVGVVGRTPANLPLSYPLEPHHPLPQPGAGTGICSVCLSTRDTGPKPADEEEIVILAHSDYLGAYCSGSNKPPRPWSEELDRRAWRVAVNGEGADQEMPIMARHFRVETDPAGETQEVLWTPPARPANPAPVQLTDDDCDDPGHLPDVVIQPEILPENEGLTVPGDLDDDCDDDCDPTTEHVDPTTWGATTKQSDRIALVRACSTVEALEVLMQAPAAPDIQRDVRRAAEGMYKVLRKLSTNANEAHTRGGDERLVKELLRIRALKSTSKRPGLVAAVERRLSGLAYTESPATTDDPSGATEAIAAPSVSDGQAALLASTADAGITQLNEELEAIAREYDDAQKQRRHIGDGPHLLAIEARAIRDLLGPHTSKRALRACVNPTLVLFAWRYATLKGSNKRAAELVARHIDLATTHPHWSGAPTWHDAYGEGLAAHDAGVPQDARPYDLGTPGGGGWLAGWARGDATALFQPTPEIAEPPPADLTTVEGTNMELELTPEQSADVRATLEPDTSARLDGGGDLDALALRLAATESGGFLAAIEPVADEVELPVDARMFSSEVELEHDVALRVEVEPAPPAPPPTARVLEPDEVEAVERLADRARLSDSREDLEAALEGWRQEGDAGDRAREEETAKLRAWLSSWPDMAMVGRDRGIAMSLSLDNQGPVGPPNTVTPGRSRWGGK